VDDVPNAFRTLLTTKQNKGSNMKRKYLLGMLATGLMVSSSFGDLVNPNTQGEPSLYQILGFNNNNDLNGAVLDTGTWSTSIGAQNASLVVRYADNHNIFGVYVPGQADQKRQIFDGTQATGTAVLTFPDSTHVSVNGGTPLDLGGTSFGFYISSAQISGGSFYSQAADKRGQADQLAVFTAAPNYLGSTVLAWEDTAYASSDKDFNDMVVTISATPVPEPTTCIAAALLLLPFGFSTLRMVRKNRVS